MAAGEAKAAKKTSGAGSGGKGRRKKGRRRRKEAGVKTRSRPAPVDPESHNVQEYLESIYHLTEDGDAARTSDIARLMKVTPASATGMIQKLDEAGYVRYEKYKGVTLTPEGGKLGRRIKRKHRILETFLTDVLGIDRDKVHDQACAMEHSLSDEAEQAMCRVLGHPEVCSDDGRPIPPCPVRHSEGETCAACSPGGGKGASKAGKEGDSGPPAGGEGTGKEEAGEAGGGKAECGAGGEDGPGPRLKALSELCAGEKARVAFIQGGRGVAKRLSDMGMTPDAEVKVEEIAPFKGPVRVRIRGTSLVLGRGVASRIFVMT